MSRQDLDIKTLKLSGGINQSKSDFDPYNECADALNVWAPDGYIQSRPGTRYLYPANYVVCPATHNYVSLSAPKIMTYIGGAYTIFDGPDSIVAGVDEAWGIGWSTDLGAALETYPDAFAGFFLAAGPANTNTVYIAGEYWNGTGWVRFSTFEWAEDINQYNTSLATAGLRVSKHLVNVNVYFHVSFLIPGDWAKRTLPGTDATERYWIRFVVKNAAISAGVQATALITTAVFRNTFNGIVRRINKGGNRFLTIIVDVLQGSIGVFDSLKEMVKYTSNVSVSTSTSSEKFGSAVSSETVWVKGSGVRPETLCVVAVPETGEILISVPTGRKSLVFMLPPKVSAISEGTVVASTLVTNEGLITDDIVAAVETRDFAVGSGAPYDVASVAQLSAWPQAKYWAMCQNRLWCASVGTDTSIVYWSSPVPYHKVWPSLNFEHVVENEATSITALHNLNENIIVYSESTISQMINVGESAFGLAQYVSRGIVRGVGTRCHDSVVAIKGNHVFLGDHGLFLFNGSSVQEVEKANATRLGSLWSEVTWGAIEGAKGHNWKSQGCYLLALPTGPVDTGNPDQTFSYSTIMNNKVLVWDYVANAAWIWDGWNVRSWIDTPDGLQYADYFGRVFSVEGLDDHFHGIERNVKTHRLGVRSPVSQTTRSAFVTGTNKNGSVTTKLIEEDSANARSGAVTFADAKEIGLNTFKLDTDKLVSEKLETKRLDFRSTGKYFQLELSNSTMGKRFDIHGASIGLQPNGVR